jgi:hypothetical protein
MRRMDDPSLPPRTDEPDPVVEAYKKDLDRSLIRDSLTMSPDERIRGLIALHEFAEELRRSMRLARASP